MSSTKASVLIGLWQVFLLMSGTAGCGETTTCWCRCPSGSASTYTEVSSSPPTCEELCGRYDCWPEDPNGCTPETIRECECEGGLVGNQACRADRTWTECMNCIAPPICREDERQECTCPGTARQGVQFCEGGDWGNCQGCDVECWPDETRGCDCGDDLRGVQTCGSDGTWGDCTGCGEPPVCDDGDVDICACDDSTTGVQYCEDGHWGACEQCEVEGRVHADVDFGTEGVTVTGEWFDIFDTTAWGCPPAAPGDDNLIWRVFPDDGSHDQTLTLEFDLPPGLISVEVVYWQMSMTSDDGSSRSALRVAINGVMQAPDLDPVEGCVAVTPAVQYPPEVFVAGGTNRMELWSDGGGSDLLHGVQGVWITYTYSE